jgi:putative ABC transport system permease protein
MVKNYFRLFFRNLKRQKLFSFINLLGLTVSIVSTMLIYLYVRQEFSFDRFHPHAERIYRVNQTFIWGEGSNDQFASTGPGVATALQAELPEIKIMTSLHTPGNSIVSYVTPKKEVISFEEEKILAADTNFFRMFNFPVLYGNKETALRQANTLVMTESTAKKYFSNENPVGKLVRLSGTTVGAIEQTYEVTAVVKDVPENSYIQFDILLSMNTFPVIKRLYWSWVWTQLETYVLLDEKANITDTRARLATIPKKYAEETLRRIMNTTFDDYTKSGKKWELFLQPMTSIHLPESFVLNRISDSGNIKIVYSLIGAAFFIILLSCVNFMNLSTAQFTRRIKEASVRKILGLGRKELSIGYFLEALMFCGIALISALALAQLALPGFNLITGKRLELSPFHDPQLIFGLTGLILLMAIVSSSYPALFLSAFHPVEAMKGRLKTGSQGKNFRDGLVVFQFSVSIILIVCTAIVFEQLNYVSDQDLGFTKENLMTVKHTEGIKDPESFVNALKKVPGVAQASLCGSVPPTIYEGDKFTADGMNDKTFPLNYTTGDEHYLETLNIKVKYGRNFDRVILNESAVKKIGWDLNESVIGKKIEYPGASVRFEVIGVISDFNYWSPIIKIEPFALFHVKNEHVFASERKYAVLRLFTPASEAGGRGGSMTNSTIEQVNQLWKIHAGDVPFQYEFVDEAFAQTFKTHEQFGSVLTVLAALAIVIACLGLLGMIIYSLEQRSKEIGIRKVSGASVWNIFTMISQGYTKLIAIAFVIGAPVAYWMMGLWLKDFSYRITPSLWVFVFVGLGTLVVAILITSYHSVKAALMNPVDVLRDE